MQIEICGRGIVEQYQSVWVTDCVRWLRRALPSLPDHLVEAYRVSDGEPFQYTPVGSHGTTTYELVSLTHTVSKPWRAPIYYFLCPLCRRRVRRLLRDADEEDDRWGCRRCHRAKYASQRQSYSVNFAHLDGLERLHEELWSRPGPKPARAHKVRRELLRAYSMFECQMHRMLG